MVLGIDYTTGNGLGSVEEARKPPFYTTYKSHQTQDTSNSDVHLTHPGPTHRPYPWSLHHIYSSFLHLIYRVDGVVGYRICLTSVHRRSSVRAWVDSLLFCQQPCIYTNYPQLALLRFLRFVLILAVRKPILFTCLMQRKRGRIFVAFSKAANAPITTTRTT